MTLDADQFLRPRRVGLILAAAWTAYLVALHPWLMNWGAMPAEQEAALPGDHLLPDVTSRFTRAITIHAPASAVWRWVVQMGQDRAGFYSYTWLENLTGAGIHNADTIHEEWQRRAIGDHVRLARPELFGGLFARTAQTRIVALEPERMIANIPGRFILQPIGEETTRLLLREAVPSSPSGQALNALAWDPMHFVMQQRMLRGIKERAEGRPLVPAAAMAVARLGWMLAGVGVAGLFLARRRRWPWVLLPAAFALSVLRSTGDRDAALAGFLAIGVTILGALLFGRRWWPPYFLLAATVALALLLAPDAWADFGIAYCGAAAVLLGAWLRKHVPLRRPERTQ